MAADKEPTVIKKYANRRLYHTGTSSYVTLEDLALLVRNGEEFLVYDAKSGEDITRSVLAQIIFEEESKTGQNLLPIAFLRQLIRFYGDSMQVLVPRYLEMSIDNLTREQHTYRDHLSKAFGATPFGSKAVEAMEAQTRANIKMFGDAMRMFTPFGIAGTAEATSATGDDRATASAGSPAKPTAHAATGEDELSTLKREMAAMRDKLDRLSSKS
ncbi:MAG: polyhydroxyalkanoate synthesis repressor PhaR [Beijerinckiaceae bacterium]|jgi:polyhydroxyalkanoate synthesis repressor PhaR|nr:polyhydroxyalkanoate synthesis repressor PhaR [Beijerinckiaceae bacterium]